MDYLDRNKEARQRLLLIAGYVLLGTAIFFAAYLLKNQADGYGIDRKGNVVQSGLTFFSSHPNPANIYVSGKLNNVKTNTRLVLPAGVYDIKLTRNGYYDWQRQIEVNGGKVQHYDYPFLFPKLLTTVKFQAFAPAPGVSTQSPDRRWMLLKSGETPEAFTLYDLKSPEKISRVLSLPSNVVSATTSTESWQVDEWADDNQHAVLQHNFDGKTEYILINIDSPEKSLNLNNTIKANPSKLTLNDKKFDQYYIYDSSTQILQKTSLKDPVITPVLSKVIAYKTYGDDTVLYVTQEPNSSTKVRARMLVDKTAYDIRSLSASSTYSLDLTKYEGDMYVVIGSATDNKAYIFKDPVGQRKSLPDQTPFTLQVLRVPGVNYVSFSPTAQYIMAQNGNRFGVYDIENLNGYNYSTSQPIDSPQMHASWMDGNRLMYVSGGKLNVFDYDYTNLRNLVDASSSYFPAFSPDYKYLYTLSPSASPGLFDLMQASLRTSADR